MQDAIRQYQQHHSTEGHRASTIQWHRERLGRFYQFLHDRGYPTDVTDLRAAHLREFITHLQTECTRPDGLPLSPAYIHGFVRSVKAFFHWCHTEELIERNHMDKVKRPKLPIEAKATYTQQEIEALLNACDRRTIAGARNFAAILLLYSAGLRAEELLGLRERDLDPQHDLVLVARGKGGKYRPVPYQGQARKAVERYLAHPRRGWYPPDPDGHIFLTEAGTPMTYQGLFAAVRRLGKPLGIAVGLHKFRHTMAVEFVREGRIETLKNILGHSTLDMTLHYARQAGVDLAKEHATADPARNLKVRV